jgi:tRNA(fMet)-specific endonuclease VapC
VAYLLDTSTLVEVLRSVPSRSLVRRLTTVSTRDRWTSVISVSQILIAARAAQNPKLMQDVVRLVAAVKVAPFDLIAAQTFAKLRATVAADADTDDVMIASIALSNDFTLVTRRTATFQRYPHLRVEDWTGA